MISKRFRFTRILFVSVLFLAGCRLTDTSETEESVALLDETRVHYPVVIVGSGPAAVTAGLYVAREGLDPLIFTGDMVGGALIETSLVENWPGEIGISGYDLTQKLIDHARSVGSFFLCDSVTSVDLSKKPYSVKIKSGKEFTSDSIIIATGTTRRRLMVDGEQKFLGRGVSVCATCDAPFYKDKEVVVVGGGRTAMTEALHLARVAKKVTVVYRSSVKVGGFLLDRAKKEKNIFFVGNSVVEKINGTDDVSSVTIKNVKTGETKEISTEGVFVAIGGFPNTKFLDGQLDLDQHGFVKTNQIVKTSKDGVFVAGDVAHASGQQAIIAAGDGARAAMAVVEYYERLG